MGPSKLQRNEDLMSDDEELKRELQTHGMARLYPKFLKAGLNTSFLWQLDDEMLQLIELDKLEMLAYKRAKEKKAVENE